MNFLNKKIMIVIGIVLLVVLIATMILAIGPAKQAYKSWKFNRTLHGFVDAMKKAEQVDYLAAMADTYGGKTPQETLQMYIEAVEKGDYELASKYFIGANQKKELEGFKEADEIKKLYYLGILNKLKPGEYSDGSMSFYMRANLDGPDYYASFKKYPNGTWKIIEI
ncbi:MAG: hypothetical protein Q7R92_01810 [bacterium]|nr:hypothetical protein [bacterium]